MGPPTLPSKCSKLDSCLIRFEYLNDHSNCSAVIRLGMGWGVHVVRPVTKLLEESIQCIPEQGSGNENEEKLKSQEKFYGKNG